MIKNKIYSNGYRLCCLSGRSGCGKSTALAKIIRNLKKPENIYIYSNTLTPGNIKKYEDIKKSFRDPKPELYIDNKIIGNEFFDPEQNKYALAELLECKHTIFIFDDLSLSELKNIDMFFRAGRHYNCSVFLIHQRYFDIPLSIRQNMNTLFIFNHTSGYDRIYQDCKTCFRSDKKIFDLIMSILNEVAHKMSYISIDYDGSTGIQVGLNNGIIRL